MPGSVYQEMLARVASRLTTPLLASLKLACADVIPRRTLEEIHDAYTFIVVLQERQLIQPEDLTFLKHLLRTSCDEQPELADIVEQFEQLSVDACRHDNRNTFQEGEDLSAEIKIVSKGLGRYWKDVGRELGLTEQDIDHIVEANPRDLKEQVHQCLNTWRHKAKAEATSTALLQALDKSGLHLLASDVRKCRHASS